MPAPQLRQVKVGPDLPKVVHEVLASVQSALDELLRRFPLLDGRLVTSLGAKAGADLVVRHGLGRVPSGWLVVRKSATGDVWDSPTANSDPRNQLLLQASADLTLSLWVF